MERRGEVNVGRALRPARAGWLQAAGESFAPVIHLAMATTLCAGLVLFAGVLLATWAITAPMRYLRNWR